jgi:arsenite methyltransferase
MESNELRTLPAADSACCEPECCTDAESLKATVRERYAEVANGEACCGSLCGCTDNAEGLAITFGYSAAELATLPEGANLGLSCGNPQAVAAMQPGETVLDLGSGAGFDCFLAAGKVGGLGG